MPPRMDPTPSDLYREQERIIDFLGNDAVEAEADRLPIQVAVPIVIVLNLSLWLGIGLALRALF